MENSYVQLRVDDIDEAAQHNDKIKSIPRVAEVILHKILKLQSFICFTPLFEQTLNRKAANFKTNSRAKTAVKIMLRTSRASV